MSIAASAETASARAETAFQPGIDFTAYVRSGAGDENALNLIVEGLKCGGCVRSIERALANQPDVTAARVNLTTGRLALSWKGARSRATTLAEVVENLGFRVMPYEPSRLTSQDALEQRELLRCLAVAGFAAANVMLLSVAVWAGHVEGMGPATRGLMHWFSALIALPAIAYAGRPFFRSAWSALKARRTNMDVPISLGVLLASGMSLVETMTGGAHAYFDSAITLLFFLLVGRYLDGRARGKARAAAERLLALDAQSVTVLRADGSRAVLPPEQVSVGMTALVAPGERVSVDGTVISGDSQVDTALITGESLPRPVAAQDRVFAGTMNLVGALRIRVEAVGETTLLAEIVRLMELAEQRRARYVSLADRLSRVYAPVVHLLALGAFLAWWLVVGIAWQPALLIAVAVLIITCPCALGLAVPAVQVIASGRLMRRGILLKSATALERLAKIDTVVFDKTGTLTLGRPELRPTEVPPGALAVAAGLAASSRHPLSQALLRAAPGATPLEGVAEVPGKGLALSTEGGEMRLGSRSWCGIAESESEAEAELWLTRPNAQPVRFAFDDPPRGDARQVIETLRGSGLRLELISGDRAASVAALADAVGISEWRAAASPAEKVARLETLAAEGRRVLMVGDGLNDAPALAAASVSLSPSTAVDIAQTAADAVFQGDKLRPVVEILSVAKRSEALVRQNFALALGYNAIAIPLALLGMVTPLLAAVAMSSSSLAVIGNSLRLSRGGRGGRA